MKKNYFKIISQTLVVTVGLVFTFCAPPVEVEKSNLLEKVVLNAEDTIAHPSKREGDAHSGKSYWRVDSNGVYGLVYIYQINDTLIQEDMKVKINTWVRVGALNHDQKYAISIEDGKGTALNWSEINFRSHVGETNKWVNVIDSVIIPANIINLPGMVLKTFSYNPDAKSFLDCDDTELSFYNVEKVMEKQ